MTRVALSPSHEHGPNFGGFLLAGRVFAIARLGTPVGLAVGTPVGSWLGTTFDWRWSCGALRQPPRRVFTGPSA